MRYRLEVKNVDLLYIAYYDSSIMANSNYNSVYFYRGLAKYHLNDLKGSIDDYSKCIERNIQLTSSFDNRGILTKAMRF